MGLFYRFAAYALAGLFRPRCSPGCYGVLPRLTPPPAALLVQPPADFPQTQPRRGQELGPADRCLLFPVGHQFLVVLWVQPPAKGQAVNTARPFDRRWLTPIALDFRGGNAGSEANGFEHRQPSLQNEQARVR